MATSMSLIKFCQLHQKSYTNWCHDCIKESSSYEASWDKAAIAIQTFCNAPSFGWTPIEQAVEVTMKLPAVKAFLAEANQEDSFEIAMRKARIRDHLANWIKAWLVNPENDPTSITKGYQDV